MKVEEEFDRDKLFTWLRNYGFKPEMSDNFHIKSDMFLFSFDISTIDRVMKITFGDGDKREIEGIFNIMVMLFEFTEY